MAQLPLQPEHRSQFYNDSIFWIDVDKIKPNPFQPRKEFDQDQLRALSESIRQYGVLQALVVTRAEVLKEDGGLATEYELIAGERRLRASKLAGLREVPVLIRAGSENNLMKLELAIIENVQREDLNAVDRAKAFDQLSKQFGFTHAAIAEKVGKSREYVTNTLRILLLPDVMIDALTHQRITEGHTRPLLMLADRPDEQDVLFKEILTRKINVREAEAIARHIAYDKVRKKAKVRDPEIMELENQLAETLGTRVQIEQGEKGGKVMIDFFSSNDLQGILDLLTKRLEQQATGHPQEHPVIVPSNLNMNADAMEAQPVASSELQSSNEIVPELTSDISEAGTEALMATPIETIAELIDTAPDAAVVEIQTQIQSQPELIKKEDDADDDLYSIKNFSI